MTSALRAEAPVFTPSSFEASQESNTRSSQTTTENRQRRRRRHPYDRTKRRQQQSNHQQEDVRRSRKTKKQQHERRRRRNGRRSRTDRDVTSREDSDEPSASEEPTVDAFPALISSNPGRQELSQAWSRAESLHDTLKETPDQLQVETDEAEHDDLFHDSRLTVLRRSSARPLSGQISGTNLPVAQTNDQSSNLSYENSFDERSRRSLDMPKLRDRWWQVLRHRREELFSDPFNVSDVIRSNCYQDEQDLDDSADDNMVTMSSGEKEEASLVHFNGPSPVTEEEVPTLDASYCDVSDPICQAIRRNDEAALCTLLKTTDDWTKPTTPSNESLTPLQLAVHLDRPNLARILTRASKNEIAVYLSDNDQHPAPLLAAAAEGRDECLQILLLNGPSVLLIKDVKGNNVLHYCSQKDAPVSTLRLICTLNNSVLAKLLSSKNESEETPVHIICQQCRIDLLEYLLATCTMSLLSKVLTMQDKDQQTPLLTAVASGSADIVMALLMWRGNNHSAVGNMHATFPCPLVWAVHSRDVDMVLLLLEFNDPLSGKGYDLTAALHAALAIDSGDECKVELLRVLVSAGANPCTIESPSGESALAVAAEQCDVLSLKALLDTYGQKLKSVRETRRRDPILQKQPESFFASMESRENAERTAAMRDALVLSLFMGWQSSNYSSPHHACSLALYENGADLGQSGLARLRLSLSANELRAMAEVPPSIIGRLQTFQTKYSHAVGPFKKKKDQQAALRYWSLVMCELPWMNTVDADFHCSWILSGEYDVVTAIPPPDIMLVTEDGSRFEAHGSIVSQKCDKLAAAIRFASMSREPSNELAFTEIQVTVPSNACRWMLQNIYHGSIVCGLPKDSHDCCQTLLDLLLVADEMLCRSLVQECEMRLLSVNPRLCFCCACARTGDIENGQIECHFQVDGPSFCVSTETAVDVLAAAQHVGESCVDSDYSLHVLHEDCMSSFQSGVSTTLKPMEALRETAINTILGDYDGVVQSELELQLDTDTSDDVRNDMSAQELLLTMCLLELAVLPYSNAQTRRHAWKKLTLSKSH